MNYSESSLEQNSMRVNGALEVDDGASDGSAASVVDVDNDMRMDNYEEQQLIHVLKRWKDEILYQVNERIDREMEMVQNNANSSATDQHNGIWGTGCQGAEKVMSEVDEVYKMMGEIKLRIDRNEDMLLRLEQDQQINDRKGRMRGGIGRNGAYSAVNGNGNRGSNGWKDDDLTLKLVEWKKNILKEVEEKYLKGATFRDYFGSLNEYVIKVDEKTEKLEEGLSMFREGSRSILAKFEERLTSFTNQAIAEIDKKMQQIKVECNKKIRDLEVSFNKKLKEYKQCNCSDDDHQNLQKLVHENVKKLEHLEKVYSDIKVEELRNKLQWTINKITDSQAEWECEKDRISKLESLNAAGEVRTTTSIERRLKVLEDKSQSSADAVRVELDNTMKRVNDRDTQCQELTDKIRILQNSIDIKGKEIMLLDSKLDKIKALHEETQVVNKQVMATRVSEEPDVLLKRLEHELIKLQEEICKLNNKPKSRRCNYQNIFRHGSYENEYPRREHRRQNYLYLNNQGFPQYKDIPCTFTHMDILQLNRSINSFYPFSFLQCRRDQLYSPSCAHNYQSLRYSYARNQKFCRNQNVESSSSGYMSSSDAASSSSEDTISKVKLKASQRRGRFI